MVFTAYNIGRYGEFRTTSRFPPGYVIREYVSLTYADRDTIAGTLAMAGRCAPGTGLIAE